MLKELIKRLKAQQDELATRMQAVLTKAADEKRTDLSDDEQRDFDAIKEESDRLDARVLELVEIEERQAEAATRAEAINRDAPVEVIREPRTYERVPARNEDGTFRSFFGDLYKATRKGDPEAMERLQRHRKEQADEVASRKKAYEAFEQEMRDKRFGFARGFQHELAEARSAGLEVEKRDLTRVDGAGGEFVPPLWLIDEYAPMARASRVFADQYNVRPLPPGTDSINIPRVATGTAAGVQTADNAAVVETDMTTNSIQVPVRTIAGQQDVPLQLLEQSPIAFDEIVFSDLIAAYNAALDVQVIDGSGAAGQILGLLNVVGINQVTYTDATPTVPEAYPKVAQAQERVATLRFLPADRIVMHPRRWFWIVAALDGQNRPLVVPVDTGVNSAGVMQQNVAEGLVGRLQGLPVYMDANMPTNKGAGVNEDRIVVARFVDHWLWESFMRTRILPEVLSGTLQVRLQLYNYAAATAARYPAASSFIDGTGLVTPTF